MKIDYSKFKDNFLKIVEISKVYCNEPGLQQTKFYLHFPEISGLKFLRKINSNIHYVTIPNALSLKVLARKSISQISN